MYTINGMYLGEKLLESGNNEINLSNIAISPGVYVYQIQVENDIITRDKLIILD